MHIVFVSDPLLALNKLFPQLVSMGTHPDEDFPCILAFA